MSLAASIALSSSGCLVANAPDYGGPQQTPPRIESTTIQPSPLALITVTENMADTPFTFKVYSEDAGEELIVAFFPDYGLVENLDRLDDQPFPPSTLDKPRTVSIPLDLDLEYPDDGCHQLTLLVMHESSWDPKKDRPFPDARTEDIASVTWWLNVRPDPANPATLPSCPTPEQTSLLAGGGP